MSINMGQLAAKFARASGLVNPVLDRRMQTVVAVGVGYMKREIQVLHAVDTGTMLNSTTSSASGRYKYRIGPTVGYAPYVALGTSRMAARPFHLNAAAKLQTDAKEIYDAADLGL